MQLNATVDAMNIKGRTPLMAAAASDQRESVETLLQCNADPEQRCDDGWKAADYARIDNNEELAALISSYEDSTDPGFNADSQATVGVGGSSGGGGGGGGSGGAYIDDRSSLGPDDGRDSRDGSARYVCQISRKVTCSRKCALICFPIWI